MTARNTSSVVEPARAPFSSEPHPPQRILVADDDPYLRHFSAGVLVRSGYQVDAAEDGEVAWKALNDNHYDLLVTDHDMPKLSGVGLLKKLHAARLALPVIMATGALPTEEFTQYSWLRLAATLLKPYTIAELLGTVKDVLSTTAIARGQTALQPHPNPVDVQVNWRDEQLEDIQVGPPSGGKETIDGWVYLKPEGGVADPTNLALHTQALKFFPRWPGRQAT